MVISRIMSRAGGEKATLREVADRAGVSTRTASAILNGSRSNTRVAEATRQRILRVAEELSYRPSALARALSRGVTDVVGFYSGYGGIDPTNLFISVLFSGLERGCDHHRKDLLIHCLFRGKNVDDIHDELLDGKIDGLILSAQVDDALVRRLVPSPLPVVAIGDPVPGMPSVGVDDEGGSRRIAEFLAARGHRRVLYRGIAVRMISAERRLRAFRAAAGELGLEVRETFAPDFNNHVSAEEEAILALPPGEAPTAAVGWNDSSAHTLMDYARRRGIAVPARLAVVGFDGLVSPYAMPYQLTTIAAPWADVAEQAVGLLVARLRGEGIPLETLLPVELRPGDTA